MLEISMSMLSNIIFGGFIVTVFAGFLYYLKLQSQVHHNLICEFWTSGGKREYLLCKEAGEMTIDQIDEKTGERIDGKTQLVATIEVPRKHIKEFPALKGKGYYYRRDTVDRCEWPIHSPIPIRVSGRICSWHVGCSEPIYPAKEHRDLPITSSAGFAAGVREHDTLMSAGMLVESMQGFMEDMSAKFAGFAKGTLNKNIVLVGFIIMGLLIVLVGAGVFMLISKLSSMGV